MLHDLNPIEWLLFGAALDFICRDVHPESCRCETCYGAAVALAWGMHSCGLLPKKEVTR